MRISWDLRAHDLPLPTASIIDGSPGATPVRLNAIARGGVRFRPVAVPLTAAQARRMRLFHRLVPVSAAFSLATGVLVIIAIVSAITGPAETVKLMYPLAAGGALANLALIVGTGFVRPKQYPQRLKGRIELADVHPKTALEWRRLTDGAVAVER
ncbi:hypothetical protein [Dactylosporangium sp. NPDC051541]|uniref:hypothetical protein n=1 Tax=Dactylosporangium sp. NPDC051541 TaxID=3363977 RepID=UPI0037ACCF3F